MISIGCLVDRDGDTDDENNGKEMQRDAKGCTISMRYLVDGDDGDDGDTDGKR